MAIDIHAHPPTEEFLIESGGKYQKHAVEYFGHELQTWSIEEMVEEYEQTSVEKAVLLGWDAETNTGLPPIPNEYIADVVDEYPDFFIGFAGIDPRKGEAAVQELERAVEDLGMKGVKLHPSAQGFFPNDPTFDPLWEKAIELDVPILTHSGTTGFGAGGPGGDGIQLKYTQPIPYIDDLAARHPELTIIMAHPPFPWEKEGVAVAQHKPNVYIDLSGYAPKYIPDIVIRYANSLIPEKFLFGTDYPLISPEDWLAGFDELDMKPESAERILQTNAEELLGL